MFMGIIDMDSSKSLCLKFLNSPRHWPSGGFDFPATSEPKNLGSRRQNKLTQSSTVALTGFSLGSNFDLMTIICRLSSILGLREEKRATYIEKYLKTKIVIPQFSIFELWESWGSHSISLDLSVYGNKPWLAVPPLMDERFPDKSNLQVLFLGKEEGRGMLPRLGAQEWRQAGKREAPA